MPENIPVNIEDLQQRNGIYYAINSEDPYNGPLSPVPVNISDNFKQEIFEGVIEGGKFNGTHRITRYILGSDNTTSYPYTKSETNYSAGEKYGLETTYHENGMKKSEINYANDKKEGLETTYHENGQKESEVNRVNGSKEGLETTYHENGQKKSEINYVTNKKEGLETTWMTDGSKYTEVNWKNGRQHGLEIEWYQNGNKESEANYVDGRQHGLETLWYCEGQKSRETNYLLGIKHGKQTKWHYKNPIHKEYEATFKLGITHGTETLWHSSGEVMKVTNYADGEKTLWHPDAYTQDQDTQKSDKEEFSISQYGLDNLRNLIDEKKLSVNITDFSPSALNQFINFFNNETPIDYIKQVIDEHGYETIASAYDYEMHKEFISQIDAKYPNS